MNAPPQTSQPASGRSSARSRRLVLLIAAIAVAVLVYGQTTRLSAAPVVLAVLALVIVMIRTALLLKETAALAVSRKLSLTDDLTGQFSAVDLVKAAVVALGIYLAYARYGRTEAAVTAPARGTGLARLLLDSYHIDDVYDRLVVRPFTAVSDWFARVFDPRVIDGLVNGVAKVTRGFSLIWRESQTGNIQHYLIGFLAGTLALLFYYLRQQ